MNIWSSPTRPLRHQTGRDSKETAHIVAETVAAAADTMTAISSKIAEQSGEAIMAGVQTAAGVGGRVADISFGRGHDLLSSATRTMDIYRDASERTAGGVQALFSSWMEMGRGLQKMQQAWLGILDHTIKTLVISRKISCAARPWPRSPKCSGTCVSAQ